MRDKQRELPMMPHMESISQDSNNIAVNPAQTTAGTVKLANGRYQVGTTIIVRNDPPKHTGHHLVTTWRDEATNEMLGYTLAEAKELVAKRNANKCSHEWQRSTKRGLNFCPNCGSYEHAISTDKKEEILGEATAGTVTIGKMMIDGALNDHLSSASTLLYSTLAGAVQALSSGVAINGAVNTVVALQHINAAYQKARNIIGYRDAADTAQKVVKCAHGIIYVLDDRRIQIDTFMEYGPHFVGDTSDLTLIEKVLNTPDWDELMLNEAISEINGDAKEERETIRRDTATEARVDTIRARFQD